MEHLWLECAVRSTLIAAGAAVVLFGMHVKAGSVCHAVWAGVMMLMMLLPLWTAWGPKARVRVLPPRTVVRIEDASRTFDVPAISNRARRM